MGRSLRSAKRTRPKVTVKQKRKPQHRSRRPPDTQGGSLQAKLPLGDWDTQRRFTDNYALAGVIADPNLHFGRNSQGKDELQKAAAKLGVTAAVEPAELPTDADLKEVLGLQQEGSAPAFRLTSHQSAIVQRLVQKHGVDDVDSMVWDTKLNSQQLTAGQLRRLINQHRQAGDAGRCRLRTPHKGLM